ncbi:sterol desaturase family protein [Cesiribacter andamanensis]|uniref:Fatty acid hydroxylase superfamily protein n=1 Tax=Cesiribacter andamanensis AMV16 TaxID=1279009 RepID=M7N8H9_9BACT|nr:sterol desaturase family protein [Cesiribacter andamanensis]EMR03521.1 Fatty acid hydroxylase superfamily protein [Cesiribacter andamanensis AMV16]
MTGTISQLIRNVYDLRGTPLIALTIGVLFVLEKRYALRRQQLPLLKRLSTNAAVVSTAMPVLRLALIPAMVRAARLGEQKRLGVLRLLPLPPAATTLLAFLALDWGNYLWHWANHRWPLLWRFHQVHHADLDMDVSTALRFHIGELLASVPGKGAWVLLIGASPRATLLYEVAFEAANCFHHSNLRLPEQTDRSLARLFVTPRMHGIHHSVVEQETNSNYSVIFTLWDRLHGSLRLDVPQERITIGLPYVRQHLSAPSLLSMPFSPTPQ